MVANSMQNTILRRPPRQLYGDTLGFKCPNHTPEGLDAGLVLHLCLLASVSERGGDAAAVEDAILSCDGVTRLRYETAVDAGETHVLLNGRVFATTREPARLRKELVQKRRSGLLHPHVGVAWMPGRPCLEVNADHGRLLRPLLVVADGELAADTPGFAALLAAGHMELLDAAELDCCLVAMSQHDMTPRTTHMELHGTAMLSSVALMTPYADHNQAPRNVFSCKQSTACASLYAGNFEARWDASVDLLHHGQRPLATTRFATAFGVDDMPYGENAIVAIMTCSGYNMEDSVMMNAAAVERGLFETTHLTTHAVDEGPGERFAHPLTSGCTDVRDALFDKLDAQGLPVLGADIRRGDALVGKVASDAGDRTVVADVTVHGTVAKVAVIPTSKGARRCKVRLADHRRPTVGDKFSSRHGQKGIVGRLVAPEDMPWTEDGVVPDIVINPHCLPSRMTVGQILEALFCKAAALDGASADATPFMKHDLAAAERRLTAAGKHAHGD
jgi:DNA-directed RNA polymerase subunit B